MASYFSNLMQEQFSLRERLSLYIGLLIFFKLVWNKFQPGLRRVPGPAIAAYTILWRVYRVWYGSLHLDDLRLHKKYGNLVRIGPSTVSVADPKWISVFYSTKEDYTKTAFFPPQSISWGKSPAMNLFSTRDPDFHRTEKRKVGNAYSMPRLLESEEAVDSCVELFMSKMNDFALGKKPVDLGEWLQYYAFDVVGEFTFARKLGFLEQGKDVDGMIHAIEGVLTYTSIIGPMAWIHSFLLGNPIFTKLMPAMESWNQVVLFTLKAINTRASIKRDGELINADVEGRDMLSRWAYVKSSNPDKMNTKDIIVHTSTNVFAGSDTTGVILRAIIYYLCRNPACMAKLVDEIDQADQAGRLSHPIAYKEGSELRYLNAVMKESMRIHTSIGGILERHVPAQGVTIDGHFLPGGTIVGINPWVTNYNEDIFPDPAIFKPERWIDASDQQFKIMDNVWEMNWGNGARKCIGRHIAWIEITKVIPELLRRYVVELTSPEKEWRVVNRWFTQQKGVICNLKRR